MNHSEKTMGHKDKRRIGRAIFIIVILLLTLSLSSYAQVTVFGNSASQISLSYPTAYQTRNFFIRVPNGTVTEARVRLQGFDILGQAINPADIVLVTDVSGSMSYDCSSSNPPLTEPDCKIRDAQRADISFLNNVNLNYMQVGLVDYSSCPNSTPTRNLFDLTGDYSALVTEINSYNPESRTNMGGGMELAMHELLSGANARPDVPKYMIVMTDGIANNYYSSGGYYASGTRCLQGETSARAYVRSIAAQAEANGIVIFGISFGGDADRALVTEITTNGISYHAPDAERLTEIYNEIAEIISVQDFPTPVIRTIEPLNRLAWRYPVPYSGDIVWNGADCGSLSASCGNFVNLVQQNLNQCPDDPCDILFSAYSTTVGMLNLSDLYIEINEPPEPINVPPSGACPQVSIPCGETVLAVDMDNSFMVTDPNDDLETLTWRHEPSLTIESVDGSYFSLDPTYNSDRFLSFSVDPAHLEQPFWRTYFFNISDPWGLWTMACINVSYEGCGLLSACGNRIIETDEECELNNTINNDNCGQEPVNCTNAPRAQVRPDALGDCGATCECVYDPWGPLVCIAPNCGAACSDSDPPRPCTIPPGFSGVQDCNTTTCQWNPCVPLGVCGDGTVNSPTEICEPALSDNSDQCSQAIENCTDAPLARIRDDHGFCNASCACLDDDWSDASCVAGLCSAQCTAGTNQSCIIDGFSGNQSCNSTTCEWGECIPNTVCGNSIIEFGEQCDDGNIMNGDGCEINCTLTPYPLLMIVDTTISFDYTDFPGYDYWLSNMLAEYAELPCDPSALEFEMDSSSNFLISGPEPDDSTGEITIEPSDPDWTESTSDTVNVDVSCFGGGETHQSSAGLTIIYSAAGAPDGEITCASIPPRYLIHSTSHVSVGLNEIFDFTGDYGAIDRIMNRSNPEVIITPFINAGETPGGSGILASSTGYNPVSARPEVRVITDNGVSSGYCPVIFFDMDSNCDQDVCAACIAERNLSCFTIHGCLAEAPILVLNPFTPVRASRYVPAIAPASYSAGFQPLLGSGFRIQHLSGSRSNEVFNVSGTEVAHNTINASVMTYTFDGYVGSTRVCPLLRRLNYTIGEEINDPITDLLITGSRAITGFYDWGGLRSKGPFIFTAKVWLR